MRALHIFTNPHLTNGATIFEFRISQILKDDEIYFDYLVTEQASESELARYKSVGSEIYRLPIDKNHGLLIREIKINREYYKFFKEHHYDIVYADTENALRAIHLLMAKFAGVPVRVVHSHNTGLQTDSKASRMISRKIRSLFSLSANYFFACSDMAAEWLLPKKIYRKKQYKLLKNGVDLKTFQFDLNVRKIMRNKLKIDEDVLVVGNVGRFMPQKNHNFMLEIFKEILSIKPNAKLLLVGTGKLEKEIRNRAEELEIRDSIIFAGNKSNISDYYQIMDVFLMPSLFEGLPITGIEAQANGLPCVFSDVITEQLKITQLVNYYSLNNSSKEWAEAVIKAAMDGRQDCSQEIIQSGYSIDDTADYLRTFYLERGEMKK
jgi:glycosyltransferase involved in cell wall biosynthesis